MSSIQTPTVFLFQLDIEPDPPFDEEEYSDSDSISDSFEDIDASGASEGVLGGCIPPPEVYKKRSDFSSNDDYAIYVRDHAQVRHLIFLAMLHFVLNR